jgi:hypothetical protein
MKKMKKYFCASAIWSVFLCNYSCSAQQTDTTKIFNSLFQCWHAVSHEYSSIYGLEESEIKSYSKQKVCFTKDSITMYYGVVYAPKYSIKKVNAENFARDNFDCGKDKLGMLTDSVYEINISSMSKSPQNGAFHKMTDVIAFDGDFLYIVKDGVIFKLFNKDASSNVRNSN